MDDSSFVDIVKAEMAQVGADNGIVDDGDTFAVWFLTKILREPGPESSEIYHIGGAGDSKLDFGIVDDQHSAVVIGQCKFRNNPLEGKPFSADLPEEVKNGLERLTTMPLAGGPKRRAFVESFKDRPEGIPVRLMAVGFGTFSEAAVLFASKHGIEIYDFAKIKERYIYNEVLGEKKPPDVLRLSLPDGTVLRSAVKKLSAKQWVFLGKAYEIFDSVENYQDGLFAENLRYRLEDSAKNGIGKDIIDTILMGDNSLPIYNNGLTIVAQRVEENDSHLILHTPQIVNGCQTSWAIHDAFSQMQKSGQHVAENDTTLLIKLIETDRSELIEKITKTTNKQNAISGRDIKANDTSQRAIALAFHSNTPKILYESKEGTWESLVREKQTYPYRIAGQRFRRISNVEAGQLYLAMLGLPYFSKQNKGKIFNDPEYYRTIFQFNLPDSERFENSTLGITATDVELSGGVEAFKEDALFAYGVYQLADALKSKYATKLKSYGEKVPEDQQIAYETLDQDFQFYKFWHYFLVASIYYVVRQWRAVFGVEGSGLRRELIGEDWNFLFGPVKTVAADFRANSNKLVYLILDEERPSSRFESFARWATSLAERLSELGSKRRELEGGKFRYLGFVDQRAETFSEIKIWIKSVFAGGHKKAMDRFPTTLYKP